MLELLVLKHGDHKDATIIGPNDGRRGIFVLKNDRRSHHFIREKESELARVVERLEHLRIEVDQSVRDVRLTLRRLGAKERQVADVQ